MAVLLLLALGALMLPPLLGVMTTGLKAGQMHEFRLRTFYAADAGVEDALWYIKNNELDTLFWGYDPEYDPYAYSDYLHDPPYEWQYSLVGGVNDNNVDVTIENVWIPRDVGAPSLAEAGQIINDAKLVITGSVTDALEYQIRIVYNYQDIEAPGWDQLEVDTIGIWLPPGFSYVAGSSNLEDDDELDPPYYCVPGVEPYRSGQAVAWDFGDGALFTDFPGVDLLGYPLIAEITFNFAPMSGGSPDAAVSWIMTDEMPEVAYSWDADTKVYGISSVATDPASGTQIAVEARTAKTEVRKLKSAIPGDYFATGNSLMTSTGSTDKYRNRLYKETSATISTDDTGINGIPALGMPEAAFLYWTGWVDWHGYDPFGAGTEVFYDDCSDLYSPASNWDYGSDWHESGSYTAFYAHHESGGGSILTLKESLDLSEYSGQTVSLWWRSWNYRSGYQDYSDCFQYSFSGNGGSAWSDWEDKFCDDIGTSPVSYAEEIPEDYLTDSFKVRFRIVDYGGSNEYVYIDNVSITALDSAAGTLEYPENPSVENLTALIEETARTNKVIFGSTETNVEIITADQWEIEPGTDVPGQHTYEGTWSYCCFYDATELIRQWIADEDVGNNASGTYTVGHVLAPNEADPDYSFSLYVPGGPSEQTGYPLGTPAPGSSSPPSEERHNFCHAGWSLIIIYTSPETYGHQLYLYDIQNPGFDFTEAWHSNPDFDGDGEDGGEVSGFIVPEPVEGEVNAAKLTVFVGEGDSTITPEYMVVNDVELSNVESPYHNVWNSRSPGLTVSGVDIDTFYIEWDDGILEPGYTSAQVDMPTGARYPPYTGGSSDGFNIVYIILSFRSGVTTGGTISFSIIG
jgi:hypothetical protein